MYYKDMHMTFQLQLLSKDSPVATYRILFVGPVLGVKDCDLKWQPADSENTHYYDQHNDNL